MDTTEKISLYKNICGYLARHYEVLPEEPPMERSIIPENIGEECNGIVAPHTQCKSGNKEARTEGYHGTSNSLENFLRKMTKSLPVQRLSIVVTLTKSASHRRCHPTFQNRSLTGSKILLARCSSRQ